jgi:hypothetical protein
MLENVAFPIVVSYFGFLDRYEEKIKVLENKFDTRFPRLPLTNLDRFNPLNQRCSSK